MIITFKKNRTHKSRPNRHLFSSFFYFVNDYVFGGQFVGAHFKMVNLTTEDKNDKKWWKA
jgi:hypothetical protein